MSQHAEFLSRSLPAWIALLSLAAPAAAQGGPGGPPPPPPPGPPLPPVNDPPQNPTTPQKVVLGKILFWEEQLSSDNTMACGTCHIPTAGGGDPRSGLGVAHPGADGNFGTPDDMFGSLGMINADEFDNYEPEASFGFDPQVTGRTAPTMIGAAFFNTLFWDGRATSQFVDPEDGLVSIPAGAALESQAVGPILSDVEMAHQDRDWPEVLAKLGQVRPMRFAPSLTADIQTALTNFPTYPDLFNNAFGTPDITVERIAFAIAAYERTLIPDQTPFDAFVAGNVNALTPQQRMGFGAFSGPGQCRACHQTPLFADNTFRNVGLRPPFEDTGREGVTGNPADLGRFKVPTLRNVALRTGFFHNGQMTTLQEVLNFYAGGGIFPQNRDPIMNQIGLPPQARNDIIAFLDSLTDPRVANELPPFDRPLLRSEAVRARAISLGGAVAGTGGFVPEMIATSPPATGSPGFRLGIANGLGGANAFLVLENTPPPASGLTDLSANALRPTFSLPRAPMVPLQGLGGGQGFGTVHMPIAPIMGLSGMQVFAQWWVQDPGAPGGFARSDKFQLTLL